MFRVELHKNILFISSESEDWAINLSNLRCIEYYDDGIVFYMISFSSNMGHYNIRIKTAVKQTLFLKIKEAMSVKEIE